MRETVAASIIQDQIAAEHPFSAIVVPPLAKALNIPHANPEAVSALLILHTNTPYDRLAVMQKLGVPEVRYQIVDYGAMIPGLQAGRFDFIAAGLYINPKRCAAILFSEPDVCGAEAFAVEAGNPHKLKTYEDIAKAGIAMATCGGCAEYDYAKKAGVSETNIVVAPDPQSGLKMLQSGRVKAYALGGPVIHDLLAKANDPKLEIVNPVEGLPPSCAGAGFRKEDETFRNAYDAALKDLKAGDAFPPLVDTYGFSSVVAKQATREQLCTASN